MDIVVKTLLKNTKITPTKEVNDYLELINSTKLLDNTYNLKSNSNIYFAGQITGVEGYVESISSGMVAALNACGKYKGKEKMIFPETTMIGALAKYISTENDKFQPMNANFGIVPELGEKIKDKKVKYEKLADRSLEDLKSEVSKIWQLLNLLTQKLH